MNRKEYNEKLMAILSSLIDSYPDLRFNQILINFEYVLPTQDDFYLESEELLERVKESCIAACQRGVHRDDE